MTRYHARTLRTTEKSDRPQQVIFVDTESDQKHIGGGVTQHTLKMGTAWYCRSRRGKVLHKTNSVRFDDTDTFWQFVEHYAKPRKKLYLVSHNLHFDVPVLDAFAQLANRGWELSQFYSTGYTNIFRWRKGERHIMALDNANFFPGDLASWGSRIGLPKLDYPTDDHDSESLAAYNERDVAILHALWVAWLTFLDEHDLGGFKSTTSATALEAFRHRFMSHPILLHDHEQALELEREAYRGGRCEVLRVGHYTDGPYYYLDFNSMYGYVMREFDYPAWLWGFQTDSTLKFLAHKLGKASVIARVDVDCDDNPYPYIHDRIMIYPTGRYTTTLTTQELRYALDRGWIQKVHAMAWYKPQPLFRAYVDYLYPLRIEYQQAGLKGWATIVKLLINGLYGKLGQKGLEQTIIGKCPPNIVKHEFTFDLVDRTLSEWMYLGGSVIETAKVGESWRSAPAIAAHVTANARMTLWQALQQAGREHVYYLDTDALIVDQQGYKNLTAYLDPYQIGGLKVARKSPWLTIHAKKDYAMKGHTRHKGIRKDARWLDDHTVKQTQWTRIRGLIHDGQIDGYYTSTVTRSLRRQIQTGDPDSDGRVIPYRLPLD